MANFRRIWQDWTGRPVAQLLAAATTSRLGQQPAHCPASPRRPQPREAWLARILQDIGLSAESAGRSDMTTFPAAVRDQRQQPRLRHGSEPPLALDRDLPARLRRESVHPGRLVVARLPLLAAHQGTPPDLLLKWRSTPSSATVDVVVHLHGHSAQGRRINLIRDIEPRSGLDLVDPAHAATVGRTSPTVLVLPRGHFYGGKSLFVATASRRSSRPGRCPHSSRTHCAGSAPPPVHEQPAASSSSLHTRAGAQP